MEKQIDQVVLVYDEILIATSGPFIHFIKNSYDKDKKVKVWQTYYTIKRRANIYFTKGNIRITLTTDDLILFYLIDKKTLMPHLENVMSNFMDCSVCMFGKKV